jgi:hypothetical protein
MPGVRPALAWVRVWHVTYTYIKEALPRLLETLGGVDRYACKTAICPGPHLIALASFERHCRSSNGGARRGGGFDRIHQLFTTEHHLCAVFQVD